MTNQTEFTPEVKAEAERLWADAYLSLNGLKPLTPQLNGVAIRALCNLLVATGWKPPVDPIKAKAREIVARQIAYPEIATKIINGDPQVLKIWSGYIGLAETCIKAGMEIGK